MDFSLNEQEKMLQTMARDFARQEVLPRAAEIDRTNEFPADMAAALAERGFRGLPFPADYSGGDAGYTGYVLALEQICQASMSVGAVMAVNTVPQEGIYRFGSEKQKQRLLRPLIEGRKLAGIGFTEPDTGSDPRMVKTVARRQGDGWIINGQKMFMSLASVLDYVLLFARQADGEGLNAYIVEGKLQGFSVQERLETMGLRGIDTSIVNLDDVYVPGENLIGEEGQGFAILLEAISTERLAVAVQGLAAAQAALDLSVEYARQRIAQGKPIARMQVIQQLLAEMAARTEAARWLVYRTAFNREEPDFQSEASKAKVVASSTGVDVTRMAMQVHGSYGVMKSLPVERFYRDAKMTEIYVGTSEVHRTIVAGGLLR